MNTKGCYKRRSYGFTLAELLIVVAIIAVLVAVAVPVFASQVEKSRESTDLANVRSAYAALMADIIDGTNDDSKVTQRADGAYMIALDPIKQTKNGWDMKIADVSIGGVPSSEWVGEPVKGGSCTISYDPSSDRTTVSWGGGFYSLTSDYVIPGDVWYNPTQQREDSFNRLLSVSNEDRLKSDKQVLKSLANYFNGMTAEEAQRILGDKRYKGGDGSFNTMLFQYGQDGGGSIRITNLDTDYVPYFDGIGYDTRIYVTQGGTETWRKSDSFVTGGHNYVDRYLFTSNQALGTKYKEQTFHNVNIKFKVKDGVVTDTEVWLNGLDKEGLTSKK